MYWGLFGTPGRIKGLRFKEKEKPHYLEKSLFLQKIKIMIQRIQTVYLIISAILIGLLFLLPFAEIAKDGVIYIFNFKGIMSEGSLKQSSIFVPVLIGVIIVLHGFAIQSFKTRARQIRVTIFTILLMMGLLGLFFFYTYGSFSGAQISFKISVLFPVIAIILDYLAIRAIGKDEALIRSIDRIR